MLYTKNEENEKGKRDFGNFGVEGSSDVLKFESMVKMCILNISLTINLLINFMYVYYVHCKFLNLLSF